MRAMFDKLPDLLDPVYSAQHHKRFASRVNQGPLKRLSGFLVSAENDIEVEVVFYRHPELGFPAFDLSLKTVLVLRCQRSLKAFDFPVETSVTGVFVETLSIAEDVPETIEVYELEEEKISLVSLIEEELLLSIPMVPIDDSSVMAYENTEQPTEPPLDDSEIDESEKAINPIAALKALETKP